MQEEYISALSVFLIAYSSFLAAYENDVDSQRVFVRFNASYRCGVADRNILRYLSD